MTENNITTVKPFLTVNNCKFVPLLIALSLAMVGCGVRPAQVSLTKQGKRLDSLHQQQDFFQLRNAYQDSRKSLSLYENLYYGCILENLFHAPGKSLQTIAEIEQRYGAQLGDSVRASLARLRLNNYVKLFDYRRAAGESKLLIGRYAACLDSAELVSIGNELNIWTALKDVPAVTADIQDDNVVALYEDRAGLWNALLTIGNDTIPFIFDTGANFSVLRRSVAERLGLSLKDTDFMVGTVTGNQVKSKLAVAPKVQLGRITWKNVVFLVFDDESLSFPQIDYHIQGILGFPEIKALREIHLSNDHVLTVPIELSNGGSPNLYFDGLLPVVAVRHGQDTLSFAFDSGANTTHLYPQFYDRYKSAIDAEHVIAKVSVGGAGGIQQFNGIENMTVELSVAGKQGKLTGIDLVVDSLYTQGQGRFGNLGQDFINLFNGFAINFETGSLWFD